MSDIFSHETYTRLLTKLQFVDHPHAYQRHCILGCIHYTHVQDVGHEFVSSVSGDATKMLAIWMSIQSHEGNS